MWPFPFAGPLTRVDVRPPRHAPHYQTLRGMQRHTLVPEMLGCSAGCRMCCVKQSALLSAH